MKHTLLYIAVLAAVTLTACKPVQTLTLQNVVRDTVYISKTVHTIDRERDSVIIRTAADTVFVTSVRTRYRERVRTDTVYRTSVDTLYIYKDCSADASKASKAKNRAGWFVAAALIVLLIIRLRR